MPPRKCVLSCSFIACDICEEGRLGDSCSRYVLGGACARSGIRAFSGCRVTSSRSDLIRCADR